MILDLLISFGLKASQRYLNNVIFPNLAKILTQEAQELLIFALVKPKKTTKMKKLIYAALAVIALGTASCATKKVAPVGIAGEWTIEKYNPQNKKPGKLVAADGVYNVVFGQDGSFFCETGCNNVNGGYIAQGDSLTFDRLLTTMMACPNMDMQHAIVEILPNVSTYEISSKAVMTIKDNEGKELMVLKKK